MKPFSASIWGLISGLCLAPLLSAQIPAPGSEGRVKLPWLTNFAEALKRAEKEKKPILLDVTTDWCGWSKKMDRETFADAGVQKDLGDFLLVRLNAEEDANEEVVKQFKVSSYPTLIVANFRGEAVTQVEGYQGVKEMREFLQKNKAVFKGNPLGYKEVQLPPEDPLFAALEKAAKLSEKAREMGHAQVLDYLEAKIQANGKHRTVIRSAYLVFDEDSFALPEPERVFDASRTKVSFKTVRILNERGQGRELDTRLAKTENVYSDESIYWEVKRINLETPQLKKGQILDVVEEWESDPILPGHYFMRWNTGMKVLVDSDIILTFPKGFAMEKKAHNCPTPVEEKVLPDGSRQWRLRTSNLEVAEMEPFTSPMDYWEGYYFLTRCTPDGIAAWYNGLCKGRDTLTPEAKSRVREIVTKHPTQVERLQAIMDWVTKDIRYVSLAFKDSTHQPHPVKDTLSRRYGDCKDQSLLVMALCREAGLPAHLVLLGSEFGEDPRLDTLSIEKFDHCIVQAVADGQTYYVDPAAGPMKVGRILRNYAGTQGLVIEGEKGRVVTFPPYQPQLSKQPPKTTIEIQRDGGAVITEVIEMEGEQAAQLKKELKDVEVDKVRRNLEERYKRVGGKLLEFSMTKPGDPGDLYQSRVKFSVPRFGMRVANGLMFQVGNTASFNPEPLAEARRNPYRFHAADPTRMEWEVVLPAGAKLVEMPESIELNEPFLKAIRKFTLKDNTLRLEEHLEFRSARLAASEKNRVYETFRKWHENRTMAHQVQLPRAQP